jgi:hypothetical protein
MKKLDGDICEICLNSLGRKKARIFGRVKRDPEFKKLCFDRVEPVDRLRFIEMFGKPE